MLLPSVRIGTISHLNETKAATASTRMRTAVRRGCSPKTSRRMRLKPQEYTGDSRDRGPAVIGSTAVVRLSGKARAESRPLERQARR
jgi:hypothetical protein